MIKAIIIDDEIHCLKSLDILLKEYCPNVQVMEMYSDPEKGLEAVRTLIPDLVFLDIEMPRMNGFEILEKLSPAGFSIVFTTGYDQYAIKAIHFSALDYLLKPVDPKELIHAVIKVEKQQPLPLTEQYQMLLKKIHGVNSGFNKIAVPTGEGFELVATDQILYLEANDNYTHIFLKDKAKITACRTLKEMEAQVQDFDFFLRVHHSYIVNLNEVKKYVRGEGGYLVMSDHSSVAVSRSRKESLLKYF